MNTASKPYHSGGFQYPDTMPFLVRYVHLLPLLLLPLIGSISSRSAAATLVVFAILLLIDRVYYKHKPYFGLSVSNPLVITGFAFLLWLGLSILWSAEPDRSSIRFVRLLVVTLPGIFCLFALQDRSQNHNFWPFLTSIFIGTLFVAFLEYGGIPSTFEFTIAMSEEVSHNRNLMIVMICSMILLNSVISHWRESSELQKLTSAGMFAICAFIVWEMIVLSQLLMIVVWLALLVFVRLLPTTATLFTAVVVVVTLLLFPILPTVFKFAVAMYTDSIPPFLQSSYIGDGRFSIWERAISYAEEHPFIGYGLDTTNSLPLIPSHPHSASLGILLDVGLIGSVLATILVLLYIKHCWEQGDAYLKQHLPIFFALFVFGNVNHGAWQSWWIALVFIFLNPNLGLHRR